MKSHVLALGLTAALGVVAAGCTGTISDHAAPGASSSSGGGSGGLGPTGSAGNATTGSQPLPMPGGPAPAFAPAAGAYKRLTASSFRNSLRDLLGAAAPAGELEQDSWEVGGLATVGAATSSVSQTGVEDYQSLIEAATTALFADTARRDKVPGCTPKSSTDTACFKSFVTQFGRVAWRQALSAAQVERYTSLTSANAATFADAYQGMRAAMSALLQSPYFLYRLEQGAPATGSAFWQYTSGEMAARLAYFLTNSTPDTTLLDLADQNGLQTADAIRAQAERLLASAPGRQSVGNFTTELLQLDIIANQAKDQELFPEYGPELQAGMAQEIPLLFASLVLDQKTSALELFTTRKTFVNTALATLYGLPTTGLTRTDMTAATLPDSGARAGLLGTAGFLSLYGSQKEGSPTERGKLIREVLLCQTIPAPPPDVSTVLTDPPAGVKWTKRERLSDHEKNPTCAGCHLLMDPLGFPLEVFDAIGKYRTTDQGKTIDATGSFDGVAFDGAVALGQTLSQSPDIAACMVRSIYRYATGHVEVPAEAAVVNELASKFQTSGFKLRDLMVDLVASDGFRFVAAPTP